MMQGDARSAAVVDDDRIKLWMDRQDFHVEYYEHAWVGMWANIMLTFAIDGENHEYLVIRGTEQGSHPGNQRELLEDCCNAWNRDYEGPAAYLQGSEEGLVFRTVFVVNCLGGMDDDQFDRLMKYAMTGSDSFLTFAQKQLSKIRMN